MCWFCRKKFEGIQEGSVSLPTVSVRSSSWRSSMEEMGLFLTSSTRAAGKASPWNPHRRQQKPEAKWDTQPKQKMESCRSTSAAKLSFLHQHKGIPYVRNPNIRLHTSTKPPNLRGAELFQPYPLDPSSKQLNPKRISKTEPLCMF